VRGRSPLLSVVVVAFNMERELPRTLYSLSRLYQRDVEALTYEVIVVDNGSTVPPTDASIAGLAGDYRVLRMPDPNESPARAANFGASQCRGRYICVILDGARVVTPGTISGGMRALSLDDRAAVVTLSWHLGPDHQSKSVPGGYDAEQEDTLLADVSWTSDGYRLFEIASLAQCNPEGWFGPLNESCCTFMRRQLYSELGGFDEAFDAPGGGLVNLDFFCRLCELPKVLLVALLGEGTFHQVHGGIATNTPDPPFSDWADQYESLRGRAYEPPGAERVFLGSLRPSARRFLHRSIGSGNEQAPRSERQ
jgi:hypothetical protein